MTTLLDFPEEPSEQDYYDLGGGFGVVEDGFGSSWAKCSATCDLEVVRPGKVQCSCDVDNLCRDDFELLLNRITPEGYALVRISYSAFYELAAGRVPFEMKLVANEALNLFEEASDV